MRREGTEPTLSCRGDRGFGSRSLHRRVYCEPDFLGSRSIKHAFTHKPPSSTTILSLSRTGASSPRPSKQASLAPSPCAWTGYKQASLSVKLSPPEPTNPMVVVRPQFRPPGVDDAARVAALRAIPPEGLSDARSPSECHRSAAEGPDQSTRRPPPSTLPIGATLEEPLHVVCRDRPGVDPALVENQPSTNRSLRAHKLWAPKLLSRSDL